MVTTGLKPTLWTTLGNAPSGHSAKSRRQRLVRSSKATTDAVLNEHMFDNCGMETTSLRTGAWSYHHGSGAELGWEILHAVFCKSHGWPLACESTSCCGLVPDANATSQAWCPAETWMVAPIYKSDVRCMLPQGTAHKPVDWNLRDVASTGWSTGL